MLAHEKDKTTNKKSNDTSAADMRNWLCTPLGQALIEGERHLTERMLSRRFGYHLLQMGCSDEPMYNSSPIGHKFCITTDPAGKNQGAIARPEAIPLEKESVDLVILHHALDFSEEQHQLLREVERVLIAGGQALIIGFNPNSTWGIRHKLQAAKGVMPWQANLLSASRLSDWLKLLDFQVEQVRYGMYAMPFNFPKLIRYSSFLGKAAERLNWPTGGVYLISARKQAVPVTPIREPWRAIVRPVGGLSISDKASAASSHHRDHIH